MFLDNYIHEIEKLCEQNTVRTLYAFGSVLTDRFKNESDIDLIVDINADDPLDYGEKYFALKFSLQDLLKRKIDLLEDKMIRNKYLKLEMDKTKSMIYGW